TKQSHYTIQNKVWEGLAMGRPVISGDSATVREALTHKEHIYLVKRNNGQLLADGIVALQDDIELRRRISEAGYEYYKDHNSPVVIGSVVVQALSFFR
ncbi:MAG: glycosyltransferase, partial [Anaerolineales bacterium]|nr:glycosyltransferase [Anaerolineales bacterium]